MEEGSLPYRWWVFIKERFSPAEHLLMVFFLVLGNSAVACLLLGLDLQLKLVLISYLVAMMFFFRLRCFDEIKDYEVDLRVNPERPLARGLLTISQVKIMLVTLTVLELAITSVVGWSVLLVHSVAIVYSYVMYKEFFIGKYLTPHLTTYAVMHTFVSVLVGYSVIACNTGLDFYSFPKFIYAFGFINWALFNLFEFARKTFSSEEERESVATYSSLFGTVGAGFLSLSQVAFALMVLFYSSYLHPAGVSLLDGVGGWMHMLLAILVLIATILFMFKPTLAAAKRFRGFCSIYLVLFFATLSWQGLMS